MSPSQLQTLDGQPMTWEEAHRRVAEYWETHELDGELKVAPLLVSSACTYKRHRQCRGFVGHPAHEVRPHCDCRCHS